MDSKTQPTLLNRLRDGTDPLAWDEFFQRYGRLVYAFALRRGCSDHTAEEIVQDVMLAVFEGRDVFHYDPARGRFRDGLAALVRNKLALHRRRPAQRIRARGGDSRAGPPEPAADSAPPDAAWEAAFEQTLLAVLLDMIRREMNPRTYQAFELFTLDGLPGAVVARMTGLSRTAVYHARKRVLARLKQLGCPYREQGRLSDQVKQAFRSLPSPATERSLTHRIARTMRCP
jgi:RNA polymerase sigma-70 factor (ECF subfamily)